MGAFKSTLTVCFDPPFWVALYQREEGGGCRVCKVVFGGEPRDQEVLDYFLAHFRALEFSSPVAAKPSPDRAVNPKRARREARKAIRPTGAGTKAQQALQLQRERNKEERRVLSREAREAEQDRRLQLRREKRKQKHRGH